MNDDSRKTTTRVGAWSRGALGVASSLLIALTPLHPIAAYEWPGKLAKALRALEADSTDKRVKAVRELVYFPLADVLPDLLAMLDDHSLPVRLEAIRTLQEMGAVEASAHLRPFLIAAEPELRLHAVRALGELGDQGSLVLVTRSLGDSDPRVREATIAALGRLGDEEGLAAVSTMLADPDPQVVMAAMDVLADVGDRTAVFALLERTNANSPRLQAHAVRALGRLGDRRAVGPLIGMIYNLHPEVQAATIEALAQIGDPQASPHLMKLLVERHQDKLGPQLLTAVGRIGDPRAVPRLLQVMRYSALAPLTADALKQIGPVAAPDVLTALNQSQTRAFQAHCLEILIYIQRDDTPQAPQAREAIAKALAPELSQGRLPTEDVLRVLLAGHHPDALGEVLALLAREEGDGLEGGGAARVKLQILEGLGAFQDTRVVEPIMALYPELEGAERLAALRLMGHLGAPEALPILTRALTSGEPQQRQAAIAAVGHIDGPKAGRLLLDELRTGSPEVLVEVGYGLGNNTAPEIARELLKIARSSEGEVQFTALQALGDHVRREPDPEVERALVEIALGSGDERAAARALDALAARPFSGGVGRLAERYDGAGPILRRKIIAVLGDWGQGEAFDVLLKATEDRSAEIRAEAAWALGRLGDERAVERLVTLLGERNWAVRLNATAALARIGSGEAQPALERVLASQDGYMRANALYALATMGEAPSRPELLRLYRRDSNPQVHEAIFRVMAARGSEADQADLRYFKTRAQQPALRRLLRQLMGELPSPAGEPWVRYILTDRGRRMPGQRVVVSLADGLLVGRISDEAGEVRLERVPAGETRLIPLDEVFRRAETRGGR